MLNYTDLKQIIFDKIPEPARPYIRLARLDRPIGIWLLLFPCWWGIVLSSNGLLGMTPEAWQVMAKVAVGALLMRSAGCIVNDLWDRKLDASVERTKNRPLATGEISVRNAVIFLGVLLLLSLGVLLTLSKLAIALGAGSLLLVAVYPKMKQITWWPQLFLGFTFNWGVLVGWAAITGSLEWKVLLPYIAGVFWTLGYDTIYAHQDKQDDERVGIKSTARLFGNKSHFFVAGFYTVAVILLITAKYHTSSPSMLTPILSAFPFVQMIWQLRVWDINDQATCLRAFKSNQLFGWLILLMLAI